MSRDWMQTFKGGKFHPLSPKVAELDLIDQAWSLSHICRYNGHVARHYSVAEHAWRLSVRAEQLGYPDNVKKWCLIHDNTEAYLGDVVRPIKHLPEFERYRIAEAHLSEMIAVWLGVTPTQPDECHYLDGDVYGSEARALKQPIQPEWAETLTEAWPGDLDQWGLPADEAFRLYLWRFKVLWGDKANKIAPDLHRWLVR